VIQVPFEVNGAGFCEFDANSGSTVKGTSDLLIIFKVIICIIYIILSLMHN